MRKQGAVAALASISSILGQAAAEPTKKPPTKETCSIDIDQSGDYDFELVSTPVKTDIKAPQCKWFSTGTKFHYHYRIKHEVVRGVAEVVNLRADDAIFRDVRVLTTVPERCKGTKEPPRAIGIQWHEYWPPSEQQKRDDQQYALTGLAGTTPDGSRKLEVVALLTNRADNLICYGHFN